MLCPYLMAVCILCIIISKMKWNLPFYKQDYKSNINLYPYQEEAVKRALSVKNGVVVMPCGAGKTQTALEIIARVGGKALWLTHTYDLLHQSMNRAKSVLNAPLASYGMISNGRVNLQQYRQWLR